MKKTIKGLAIISSIIALNGINSSLMTSAYDETAEYKYIDSALSTYLDGYNVDKTSVYVSAPYTVYNADSKRESNNVYAVFENDAVIGLISVADTENGYYSSFEYNHFETLQSIYEKGESFCFVSRNMSLYIKQADKVYSVDNAEETIEISCDDIAETKLERVHKAEIQNIIIGDVNSNGAIDISDAAVILEYYAKKSAGIEVSDEVELSIADVNKDGVVDMEDAAIVLKIYAENAAGIDVSLSK